MNKSLSVRGTVSYLARLLNFAIRDGADEVAARLVEKYGTLDILASVGAHALLSVEGLTPSAINLLKITAALTARRVTDGFAVGKKHTEFEIKDYLSGLYHGTEVETVYLILLDGEGRTISTEYMGEGTVGASDVYPRRLLEAAIKRGASGVILAHNHPRGNGRPSIEDVNSTERLTRLFESAGISLVAHYVVSGRVVDRITLTSEK